MIPANSRILFDGNDTQFLSKVDQKIGIENVLRSPVTVNVGSDDLALSLEARGAHGREKALDFPLVGGGSIPLKIGQYPRIWSS